MTKGLMDRALHQETALERVREKARLADEELLAEKLEGGDGEEAQTGGAGEGRVPEDDEGTQDRPGG